MSTNLRLEPFRAGQVVLQFLSFDLGDFDFAHDHGQPADGKDRHRMLWIQSRWVEGFAKGAGLDNAIGVQTESHLAALPVLMAVLGQRLNCSFDPFESLFELWSTGTGSQLVT